MLIANDRVSLKPLSKLLCRKFERNGRRTNHLFLSSDEESTSRFSDNCSEQKQSTDRIRTCVCLSATDSTAAKVFAEIRVREGGGREKKDDMVWGHAAERHERNERTADVEQVREGRGGAELDFIERRSYVHPISKYMEIIKGVYIIKSPIMFKIIVISFLSK
ncbi:hypothetical protein ACLOJK_015822 [Asimina triloba]